MNDVKPLIPSIYPCIFKLLSVPPQPSAIGFHLRGRPFYLAHFPAEGVSHWLTPAPRGRSLFILREWAKQPPHS